jgi:thiamine-phosphate pyrophosphorylase
MKIICVTNRLLCENNFLEQIEKICKSNVYAIILREKDLDNENYERLFIDCQKICKKYNIPLFVNSKTDVAIKLNCKNIQLSFKDFLNNKDKLSLFDNVGVSVHSLQEATSIEEWKIRKLEEWKKNIFLIAGHIFKTECKKGLEPKGTKFLKDICDNVNFPVFAIGGINSKTINQLKNINIEGVCLMSTFMKKVEWLKIFN